jgi:hypothetical protein
MHIHSRNGCKVPVMRPDLSSPVLKCDYRNLEVEYAAASNLEGSCPAHQPHAEPGSGSPDVAMPLRQQVVEKVRDDGAGGRSSEQIRLSHNPPEFRNRRQADSPTSRIVQSFENGRSGDLVLRRAGPVRIHEQIRVDRDHLFLSNHSYIASRFDKSRPRARPPFTVISVTCFLRALTTGFRSARRRPSSKRARKGLRCSAALCFAAIMSSSGRSTVVFIAAHITIFMDLDSGRGAIAQPHLALPPGGISTALPAAGQNPAVCSENHPYPLRWTHPDPP